MKKVFGWVMFSLGVIIMSLCIVAYGFLGKGTVDELILGLIIGFISMIIGVDCLNSSKMDEISNANKLSGLK